MRRLELIERHWRLKHDIVRDFAPKQIYRPLSFRSSAAEKKHYAKTRRCQPNWHAQHYATRCTIRRCSVRDYADEGGGIPITNKAAGAEPS